MVTVGGMIVEKTIKYTRNNQVMAFLTLEDLMGTIEVIVFPRDYEKFRKKRWSTSRCRAAQR